MHAHTDKATRPQKKPLEATRIVKEPTWRMNATPHHCTTTVELEARPQEATDQKSRRRRRKEVRNLVYKRIDSVLQTRKETFVCVCVWERERERERERKMLQEYWWNWKLLPQDPLHIHYTLRHTKR
jgi:pantothenate kinase-related protein Tda10